jgi:arsenate reductase-like glutaredoxin family protein
MQDEGTKLYVAKTKHGPVFSDDGESTGKTCYVCGHSMHWVRQFERKVNGIKGLVKGHFRHTKRPADAPQCNPESAEHLAAKHAIAVYNDWTFSVKCCGQKIGGSPDGCAGDGRITVDVGRGDDAVRAQEECTFLRFKLDVGFVQKENDKVVGAVEIKQTHAIDDEKRDELTQSGIAWVEVQAQRVLDACRATPRRASLNGLRCAALQCDVCKREDEELVKVLELAAQEEEAIAERAVAELELAKQENEAIAKRAIARELLTHSNLQQRMIAAAPDVAQRKHVTAFWTRCCYEAKKYMEREMEKEELKQHASLLADATLAEEAQKQFEKEYEEAVNKGDLRLTFGKHKGTPMTYVLEEDASYVRWVAGWSGYRNRKTNRPVDSDCDVQAIVQPGGPEMQKRARELLKSKCLLCFENSGADWKNWCAACYPKS